MKIFDFYLKALKNYFVIEGRATRAEFWYFVLVSIIISILLNLLGGLGFIFSLLNLLYGLFILIPATTVEIRRLHDIGKSGWMILIGLIPLIGWVWIIYLLAKDGDPGENKYGPNPKEQVQASTPIA
ncbi:MAG: DUF805 domain-containing protein [Minisyncoccia bacterium]